MGFDPAQGHRARRARPVVLALLGLALLPAAPSAHEIPADVVVRAFVRAEDGVLRLVVRVPLASMRDVVFPTRGPGYVDLERTRPLLPEQATLWIAEYVRLFENGEALPTPAVTHARISLPSDPSFATYEDAVSHVRAPPLAPTIDLIVEQALLDVVLETPVGAVDSRFAIDPSWSHLGIRTTTVLRFITPSGHERAFQYRGSPGTVRLDPRWHQALLRFVSLGFFHILDGVDHLLFLLCLILPVRRIRALVPVVTAFTVAHSITLIASVMGLAPSGLWFPPLIEMLIAGSIVYMALENIVGGEMKRRWAWAFGFGLVHGFGFSFLLRESLQFAGTHLVTSLLAFNVGVELGQLFALVVLVPTLSLALTRLVRPRVGTVVLSALVAHTGWHWMTDRWQTFAAYDLQRPVFDAAFAAQVLDWLLLLLIVTGVAWGLSGAYGRLAKRAEASQDTGLGGTGATVGSS